MIDRRDLIALGVSGAVAVAMPLALLQPGAQPVADAPAATQQPIAPPPQPALSSAFERTLFGSSPAAADESAPQDAPALIGIVGRLDQDAVALVRTADGTSRTLAVGASVDGWKLESLSIDAGYFTRGAQRVRVPLPSSDAPADALQ
ncbi:hypothetical protein [Sphingomonas sp. G-3-2-10]|uniref:hypothetical protein n=1 Tax=Sphingomonas sp. G-3-2-10 TaxID=2728838 RepID=UPI00146A36B1|nr:hypothetical protein [Sphingomonas sp. G-3-2-10]NML05663.1 hypothetical protein [Sphingomonas sp. G-3-2-10]